MSPILTIEKNENIPKINDYAVHHYMDYFNMLLNNNTYRIRSVNDQIYYAFSNIPFIQWKENLSKEQGFLTVTLFLDHFEFKSIPFHAIKMVEDVTVEVQTQYQEQKEVVFTSLRYVVEIMKHPEIPLVQKAIKSVMQSRSMDDSKRKYWRVLNEKYYGLDIHPLMEYEVYELENLLYYCNQPELIPKDNPLYLPMVIGSVATSGAVITGLVIHLV